VSFLLAGAADSLAGFTVALVLQGFLGGTFAATNGFLGAALRGPELSRALTLMQGSARAALVAAPVLVGALTPWISPHRQYLVLAALPLAAAALLSLLPEPAPGEPRPHDEPNSAARPRQADGPGTTGGSDLPGPLRLLYAVEFAFVFCTIVSYPYLIALVHQRLPGDSGTVAGLLFALPHLCYLVSAGRVHRAFLHRPHTGLALGFALIALGLAGHGPAHSPAVLVLARLLLGAGMTLGLVCLSVLAAEAAHGRSPGRMFGALEAVSKSGAVAAGVVAALVNSRFGPTAPVLVGTVAALAALALILLVRLSRRST
jgi:MFS family permease